MDARPEERMAKLLHVASALASRLELKPLLETIMDAVIEISGAERGFLILMTDGEPTAAAARNMDGEEVQRAREKVSRTILEKAFADRRPVVVADAAGDAEFKAAASVQAQKVRSVCAIPLIDDATPIGAIYLDNRFKTGIFAEGDLDIFNAFAANAVVALRNARMKSLLETRVASQGEELRQNRRALKEQFRFGNIVGKSRAMRDLFRTLEKVADTHLPILIQGESGVGKELVARAIHANGPRQERAFISLNCGAVPPALMESELFGHVRGAFTGADKDRPGLFELAHTGTLFLDEIACTSAAMQQGLLRVLQEGELRRVGGRETVKVDVRVIAAGNADLLQLVEDGEFREDLYYRLNVIPVRVPPLRERRDDIPLLAGHFLTLAAKEANRPPKRIAAEAMEKLLAYGWPGNVRELENLLRRLAVMVDGETIAAGDIAFPVRRRDAAGVEIVAIDEYTRRVYEAHRATMDHKAIADKLGISRKALWEKRKLWENA